ncbi:MAG: NAD(P)/FAD-dependent oxidoreductase [Candidatus Poribacteria bacterium]|nr:NAD(P)/FAD-dependent oxidoreductase [Candidatus Poribacteria bacterium]
MKQPVNSLPADNSVWDAVVVGAGISGLYMLHRLRQIGFSCQVIEAGADLGGTWYWNRYPGARCDTYSLEYSYSFCPQLEQEWQWSERYPSQGEIWRYLNHVAHRFDLRSGICFNTRVVSADFQPANNQWQLQLDPAQQLSCRFLLMATGCLSSPNMPDIDGLQTFKGPIYHTARWPQSPVDFSAQRVGVIGNGSSGLQIIPELAPQVKQLVVFQRTAQYAVPSRNRPLDRQEVTKIKADYPGFRARNRQQSSAQLSNVETCQQSALSVSPAERQQLYQASWQQGGFVFYATFNDLMRNQQSNQTAAEFIRTKIGQIVNDPQRAKLLSPQHVMGCKRPALENGYFETFNRPNVDLVDISANPIRSISPRAIHLQDQEYPLEAIVMATGFDAMTGALMKIDICGLNGLRLKEKWSSGPHNYLGLSINGFPNLFTITGPGSPSVLTNMMVAIEQHVEWISDCLQYMRQQGYDRIQASAEAEAEWVQHVNRVADETLYTNCNSWYLGANIPGKPRVFMPLVGFPPYAEKCRPVVAQGYQGFILS